MTYSVSLTGVPADFTPNQPAVLTVDDSVAQHGSERLAMQLNTPFLCKGPDGGQAWYIYDSERTIPGRTLILKKV